MILLCTRNIIHIFRIVGIFYYICDLVSFTQRHCKYLGTNFQVISRYFIYIIICIGIPGQDFLGVSEQGAWCTFNVIHSIPLQVPWQNQLASHVTYYSHVTCESRDYRRSRDLEQRCCPCHVTCQWRYMHPEKADRIAVMTIWTAERKT